MGKALPSRRSETKQSLLRHAILGILCERESRLDALQETIRDRVGDLMGLSRDRTGTALAQLVANGWASLRGRARNRRDGVHSVTAAGRKEFQRWLRQSISCSRLPGDDVFLQLLLLPSADQRVIGLVIDEERRAVLSLLNRRGEAKQQFAKRENWGHRLFTDLLIISALFQSEAALAVDRHKPGGSIIKVNFRQPSSRRKVIYG